MQKRMDQVEYDIGEVAKQVVQRAVEPVEKKRDGDEWGTKGTKAIARYFWVGRGFFCTGSDSRSTGARSKAAARGKMRFS